MTFKSFLHINMRYIYISISLNITVQREKSIYSWMVLLWLIDMMLQLILIGKKDYDVIGGFYWATIMNNLFAWKWLSFAARWLGFQKLHKIIRFRDWPIFSDSLASKNINNFKILYIYVKLGQSFFMKIFHNLHNLSHENEVVSTSQSLFNSLKLHFKMKM